MNMIFENGLKQSYLFLQINSSYDFPVLFPSLIKSTPR